METTGENASSVCVVCRKPEARWSCQRKGCNRTFHFHCAKEHRPDDFITVGESETIYWVKHKNLAHMYNCWKPESVIHREAPELMARFIREYKQDKGTTWKKEWTRPERLLLRRNLMHADMAQTFFQDRGSQLQSCNTEWLVKWKGLGYEHATWELGSLKLLDKKLKQEHNHRQIDAARRAKLASEHNKIKKGPFVRLEALSIGLPHDLDDGYLDSLNRLRQFWHKSQNAVLIDQEEKVRKIVLFIKSIVNHTAQPFLILSTVKSLSLWEDKIGQLIPSVHTVVHTNRSASFLVEVTEFWGQDGHLLFQVFLSHPDAIQGFQAIKQISWEGVIVDQCDNVNMSTHLEQIKLLSADFKMLILNSHLKDDPSQYAKLLSVLEPGDAYSVPDISILKERFSRYIAYPTDADAFCQEVPFAGEKEGALSEVLDKGDCCQYLSSVVNPRKRKESPNDVMDLSVSHGLMLCKRRFFLEKPASTAILESFCEDLVVTLSMEVANLSLSSIETDVPTSADISIATIKKHIVSAERSNHIIASKDGIRTIHFLLIPRLLRSYEMLGIPDYPSQYVKLLSVLEPGDASSVPDIYILNNVANMFFNHVLKSHRAMLAPFIIPKSYLREPLEVVSSYKGSSLNGLWKQFLHCLEIAKRIPRLGYCDVPIAISPNAQQEHVVPQENKSLEHKIERICARRENELRALQKSERVNLQMHAEREFNCQWKAHESVVKNKHAIKTSDKKSNVLLEKTIQKFNAFNEHMVCQRRRLRLLQKEALASEKLRKEEWFKMVKSGELGESFDFSKTPLPISGFVFEKFDWVCGTRAINCGACSSQENVLETPDHGQPTVGDLSSGVTGAITNMGEPPNRVQQHDEPVGSQSRMCSVNASSASGSNSAVAKFSTQQETEAAPFKYAGASSVSHEVRISKQLNTNTASFLAEGTPINLEELPDCDDMLLEPVQKETNSGCTGAHASMPDIGVSTLLRPDVLSESSSNFLEMPSFTQEMFSDGLNMDPFKNELTRISYTLKNLAKKDEEKKLSLRSQFKAESQNIKKKYDELTKEMDAQSGKLKKFLLGLSCKVEGGQTAARELRAFEMAAESDILLQNWNRQSFPQNSPNQSACQSEPAFMDCTSFGLSPCMPPIKDTRVLPVEIGQAPPIMTNQVPSVQTHLAPPLTTNRVPAVHSNLGSNEASMNLASAQASVDLASARLSAVHAANFSHIWNRQNHGIPIITQHLLTTDTLGMSPSTSRATYVQKTKTPTLTTAPVSPVQVPHVRADLPSPRWTSIPRPTSTSQVPPVIAGMPPSFAGTVAPSTSPVQPMHLHTGRSQTVMRNWTPPGSQRAFNPQYTLRSPSPYVRHRRPYISMSRPQAPPPECSYNVPKIGGSISGLDQSNN
ncbi:uncharacterized protein LOC144571688 isoform X2 [Carex rostrata]